MNEQKEIPKGWSLKKLGEICFTTSGGTPSRKVASYYEGNIPWVKSGELDKGLITKTEEYISEQAVENSSAKIFPKGTLLIALYGATIGKLGFLGIDAATNQAICGIFKNEIIDLQFLKYYLFNKRNKLIEQGAGGAQPNISQTILKDLDVVVPPLPEQHRIVAKIEELFSSLDKGIESLKTAQQQLKVYRQAVLKWAFEGRFGHAQRPPNSVKEGELPEGWVKRRLGDVGEIISGGTPSTTISEYWNGNISWISPIDLSGYCEKYIAKGKKNITELGLQNSSARIMPAGSILFSSRAPIGYVAISKNALCTNQGFKSIVPKNGYLSDYIYYFLKSAKKQADELGSGTTFKEISKANFSKILIPLPPTLEEQHHIVSEIEKRLSVADKLEESITTSLQQAEALRQSILKKAFEGKLVPQDPNDEPASVLLERIASTRLGTRKAEREAHGRAQGKNKPAKITGKRR